MVTRPPKFRQVHPDSQVQPDDGIVNAFAGLGIERFAILRLTRSPSTSVKDGRSLREHGIVLYGPTPKGLVDAVDPEGLRSEVRTVMAQAAATGLHPLDRVYWMAFWVGLYCRMLHTLETGIVVSKTAACEWAAATLEPRWRPLIERARAVRNGDRDLAMAPTTAADITMTRAFVHHAMSLEA